jgi:putative methyltransferase
MNFYLKCAHALKFLRGKKGNFKTILFGLLQKKELSKPEFQKAYPILIKTASNLDIIDHLIDYLEEREKGMEIKNKDLIRIFISELLLGKYKKIKGGGKLKKLLMSKLDILNEEYKRIKALRGESIEDESHEQELIRKRVFVRILQNKTNLNDFLKDFQSEEEAPIVDNLIPGLVSLSYPQYQSLRKKEEYQTSKNYIIQSKSSCIPPYLLCKGILKNKDKVTKRIDFIDACSAPGNKTTQLAEYWPKGNVFAIERDNKRFNLLNSRTQFFGFSNITCIYDSFLNLDPKDRKFENVRFILVDPTCSGSGMINNLNKAVEDQQANYKDYCKKKLESLNEKEISNLYLLQKSQLELLDHASKFPNVLRISYSTCSIYEIENEDVAKQFLISHPEYELVNLNKYSKRRGFQPSFDENCSALRADPRDHGMDGFFVCIFKKRKQ